MLDAKKLVAVFLRLFAGANILYVVGGFIVSAFMTGSVGSALTMSYFVPVAAWLFIASFLYLYAIPLARFIAGDIDDQH